MVSFIIKTVCNFIVITLLLTKSLDCQYSAQNYGNNWKIGNLHNSKLIGRSRDSSSNGAVYSSVCKEENGQFVDPQYCDKYWDCWEGKPVSSGQCPHGLMFNEQTSSCDYPANVNCDGKEVAQPLQDLEEGCEEAYGTFPNRYYCDQYTVCHAGMALHHRCDPGLAFDEKLGMCSRPQESPSCLDGGPPEDQPEIPLDPENIKPIPPSGPSAGSGDNGISFPIIPEGISQSVGCPIQGNGFIPIVNDCQSVLVCMNGRGFLLQCPKGEYYFPKEAKCRVGIPGQCEQMKFTLNTKSSIRTTVRGTANFNKINDNSFKFGYFWKRFPLLP